MTNSIYLNNSFIYKYSFCITRSVSVAKWKAEAYSLPVPSTFRSSSTLSYVSPFLTISCVYDFVCPVSSSSTDFSFLPCLSGGPNSSRSFHNLTGAKWRRTSSRCSYDGLEKGRVPVESLKKLYEKNA